MEKKFGRYVIVAELGKGAMGSVHRAVDPVIEREVAIKTLHPNLPEEIMAEVRERFIREARSAGRLNHPNIVTVYDVGEQDGIAYIAMELLEGRSLQEMIRDPARLPFETIAELVAQVADGLDHAQKFGIVHRDIKPANIMVSSHGRAKLTDFGVAHVPSSSMTQTGSAIGSPRYMSPEQVTGQPIDPRSDIFSLGTVLYEMLVGKTPFDRPGENTVFALMNRIAGEPHEKVTKTDPKIPSAFDLILDCALAKSSANRYARAGDMANDLRNYKQLVRAGGPAPGQDRTIVLGPAARPAESGAEMTTLRAAPVPRSGVGDETGTRLIADIDAFAKDFEREQQERLRVEEEARLRKEEEVRRWGEEQEKRRLEFEREQEAKAGKTSVERRSAALEMLKKKAEGRKVAIAEDVAKRAESAARVDERMRSAFHYLSEFTTMLNDAHPVSDRKQGVMYFGEIAGMSLGDGFTDYRTRQLDGKERFDFVTFKYKVSFTKPTKLEVSAQQLQRIRERLDTMRIKYSCTEKKNEFGEVATATFQLTGPFPCQTVLRADYDKPGFVFEMMNVRRHGPAKMRLGVEELTDAVLDEFGTWVLGADDSFERFLKRG